MAVNAAKVAHCKKKVKGFGKNNKNFLNKIRQAGPGIRLYSSSNSFPEKEVQATRNDTNATPQRRNQQEVGKDAEPVGMLTHSQPVDTIIDKLKKESIQLGPYLAGLIEGDGTFAIHDKDSTVKKYNPVIIIVFKKADLPLANYLQKLTNSGRVYIKSERGYVL